MYELLEKVEAHNTKMTACAICVNRMLYLQLQ